MIVDDDDWLESMEPHSPFRTLADLLADPNNSSPPQVMVPRLAWRGRTSLIAGREKGGKSTMVSYGAAKVSTGSEFLDDLCPQGRVVWVGLEEHVADVSTRFLQFGADPHHVFVGGQLARPFEELEAATSHLGPALIVVDTLAAFAETMVDDARESAAWTPVMLRFSRLAHLSGAAVVLLHHARKSDGSYRDSTAIGAGVDVIVEMRADAKDATIRHLKARGRFPVQDSSIRFTGTGFELTSGSVPLDHRIVAFVTENPGCSKRQLREGIAGQTQAIGAATDRLIESGEIENRGAATGCRLFCPEPTDPAGNRSGTTSETVPVPGSPLGFERENRSKEVSGSPSLTLGDRQGTATEVHLL